MKINLSQSSFKRQGLLECKREVWSCRWAVNLCSYLEQWRKKKSVMSMELIQNRVGANGWYPVTWWVWQIQRKTMGAQSYLIETLLFHFYTYVSSHLSWFSQYSEISTNSLNKYSKLVPSWWLNLLSFLTALQYVLWQIEEQFWRPNFGMVLFKFILHGNFHPINIKEILDKLKELNCLYSYKCFYLDRNHKWNLCPLSLSIISIL